MSVVVAYVDVAISRYGFAVYDPLPPIFGPRVNARVPRCLLLDLEPRFLLAPALPTLLAIGEGGGVGGGRGAGGGGALGVEKHMMISLSVK